MKYNQKKVYWRVLAQIIPIVLVLFVGFACTPSTVNQNSSPLMGKIYQTAQARFVSENDLVDALHDADILLLGETHDNPRHHQHQAELIRQYLDKAQTGLAALEMMTDTQAEEMLAQRPEDAGQLIDILKKEDDGWEYDKYYKGVFQALFDKGYMLTAANLSRKVMGSIVMQGEQAIPSEVQSVLKDVPLNEENTDSLQKEIESSHCGMMLGRHAKGMITGQRVRDAYMAKALVDGKTKADKVVLVAGSGHVRSDRGVPLYIKYLAPNLKVLTVAFAEFVPDHTDPADYAKRWGADRLPFDYVWFTSAVDRPDPCEELREHMKKMQHGNMEKPSSDN